MRQPKPHQFESPDKTPKEEELADLFIKQLEGSLRKRKRTLSAEEHLTSEESQSYYEEEGEEESPQESEEEAEPDRKVKSKNSHRREVFRLMRRLDEKSRGCFSDFTLPAQVMSNILQAAVGPPGEFTDMAVVGVENATLLMGVTALQTAAHYLLRALERVMSAPEEAAEWILRALPLVMHGLSRFHAQSLADTLHVSKGQRRLAEMKDHVPREVRTWLEDVFFRKGAGGSGLCGTPTTPKRSARAVSDAAPAAADTSSVASQTVAEAASASTAAAVGAEPADCFLSAAATPTQGPYLAFQPPSDGGLSFSVPRWGGAGSGKTKRLREFTGEFTRRRARGRGRDNTKKDTCGQVKGRSRSDFVINDL
jgi:hypothetical protein